MYSVQDYVFTAYAGIDNCTYCDAFTHVNQWETPENLLHLVCGECESVKRFKEL